MNYQSHEYSMASGDFATPVSRSPRVRRWLVFLAVFLPCMLASQTYIFLQPAIYQSVATVLTTAATDLDQDSSAADLQHVSIQKQILLSNTVLEKTQEHLQKMLTNNREWHTEELRNLFTVADEPNTNLVHLKAEGPDPAILRRAVNAWIESYIHLRSAFIAENTDKVIAELHDQLGRIERQVLEKRNEIDKFRLEHDILSTESSDNQAHARLQGLNKSLNTALEEEVKAKAKLDTVIDAISRNEVVVPESDTRAMAVLLQQAEKLREELAAIEAQYTQEYIDLNPNLRRVREQLLEIEGKITDKASVGKNFARQEAQNNYAAAQQAVTAIKQQMQAHKQLAAAYTSQFAEHQALQQELLKLETLQQDTKQRLADIEVKQRESYPQVDVVDWASLPETPIRPNYLQESLLALAISLCLALLSVMIIDYLNRDSAVSSPPALMTLGGIHLHHQPRAMLDNAHEQQQTHVGYDPIKSLPADISQRELNRAEVLALRQAADPNLKLIISLLYNGLSLSEILTLAPQNLDTETLMIIIPQRRNVLMNASVAECLGDANLWSDWPSAEEIETLVCCTAIDCGLPDAQQINTETLRHNYLLFLVRQGIKLADLAKIAGTLAPSQLRALSSFSPAQPGLPLETIELDFFSVDVP